MKVVNLICGFLIIQLSYAFETTVIKTNKNDGTFEGEYVIAKCKHPNKLHDLELVKKSFEQDKDKLKAKSLTIENYYLNSQEKFPFIDKKIIDKYPSAMTIRKTGNTYQAHDLFTIIKNLKTYCGIKPEYLIPPYPVGSGKYVQAVGVEFNPYSSVSDFSYEIYDPVTKYLKQLYSNKNCEIAILEYYNPKNETFHFNMQLVVIHNNEKLNYAMGILQKIMNSSIPGLGTFWDPKNVLVRVSDLKRIKQHYPAAVSMQKEKSFGNNGSRLKSTFVILLAGYLAWFLTIWEF